MKRPRQLTPHERRLWQETNKHTVIRSGAELWEVEEVPGGAPGLPPLPTREATRLSATALSRSGEGALKPGAKTDLNHTSSPREHLSANRQAALRPHPDFLSAVALENPTSPAGRGVPAAPLSPLTSREAAKRFKPHGAVEATLDLHGLTKLEARSKVQQFIARAHAMGRRHVAIITGKGRGSEIGVLRQNLPDWLNEPGLRARISGFAHAKPEKGGAGVTHVLLKR